MLTDPTLGQLDSVRAGIDYVLVAPPRSKPDQWGEIHCPFPVALTFDIIATNPAARLRDIELRFPCHGAERDSRPLFSDAAGGPYSHGYLAPLLKAALTHLYGPAVASLYTFHSYRSGLATALHAAGVPDPTIQLICRWMCPESLHVYRRMGTREHEAATRRAAAADVDVMQSGNAPRVSADEGYARLSASLQGPRGALAQREYEAVRAAVTAAGAAAQPTVPVRPPPTAEAPVGASFAGRPPPGAAAFAPASLWPRERSAEFGGAGWAVQIVSSTRCTSLVSFA